VCKIDELEDAVHHGVTKRDQGIDRAKAYTIDEMLNKIIHEDP
jgi:hypothetical protein